MNEDGRLPIQDSGREELRRLLTDGLALDQPLAPPWDQAPVEDWSARDTRAGVGEPLRRIVRFVSLDGADRRRPLRERLQVLLANPLPNVLVPREAAECGERILLIYDDVRESLAGAVKEFAPAFARNVLDEILEQALTGLAALHDRGISHGDLRPGNLFLRETAKGNKAPIVWIGNVELGCLAHWSNGQYLDGESARYFPPEWNGVQEEPSPQSDLYALGVLAAELTKGKAYVPEPGRIRLDERMTERCVGSASSWLARRLMQGEPERPRDAREALQRFRKRRIWIARRPVVWAAGIAGAASLACCLSLFSSYATNSDLVAKLEESRREIARLEKPDGGAPGRPTTSPADLKTAGDLWNRWANNDALAIDDLAKLIDGQTLEVSAVLKRWLAEIVGRTSWKIQLTSGSAPAGYGTYRVIYAVPPNSVSHDWNADTSHTYAPGAKDSIVRFDWKAGAPLQIQMYGPRSYTSMRYQMLDKTFAGPLAIWRAHRDGRISEDGISLDFEVVDCPGPSRDPYRPVRSISGLPSP